MNPSEYSGRGSGPTALRHLLQKGEKVLLFARTTTTKRNPQVWNTLTEHTNLHLCPHIRPNPRYEEIMRACRQYAGQSYSRLIAWGGGSVIDFTKAFRYFSKRSTELIAVPTTAGTGSEATQFAAIYRNGVKESLDHPTLLPNAVILDSMMSEQAPQQLKATCALDAYCQAIESFWAVRATEESREYALHAVSLCRDFMHEAVCSTAPLPNEKMMLAAHLSGKAINISRTTAAHALSYKLTFDYGIPHGHAVALCMCGLFGMNLEACAEPGRLLHAMGIGTAEVPDHFRRLTESFGLAASLRDFGITDIDGIAGAVNRERLKNNPRLLTHSDLVRALNFCR